MNIVTLDSSHREIAKRFASLRQDAAAQLPQRHGCQGGLEEHLLGATGEIAFTVWAGLPPVLTLNTYRALPDFPGPTEVRTRSRSYWDLIIRVDDNPAAAYVLVVPWGASGSQWRIAGWCWGWEAQSDPALLAGHGGREPAFFVPQEGGRLRDMGGYWSALLTQDALEPFQREAS